MNSTFICHITEEEKKRNSELLQTFRSAFSSNCNTTMLEILHPKGHFFGKMSRHKACGVFHTIFFGKNSIAEKYWMDVHKGISIDHLPGEAVLELRVSYFDPFCNDDSEIENKFGDKPNLKFEESIFRFAFTFKDGLIYSIRVPKKCTADILNLSQNN